MKSRNCRVVNLQIASWICGRRSSISKINEVNLTFILGYKLKKIINL